jgi:hypothetical protein
VDELRGAISESLHENGFDLLTFHLREVDLGPTGEVAAGVARAKAELELEATTTW